jgi:LmbE family N-acetylglucosaminyl deacetylase
VAAEVFDEDPGRVLAVYAHPDDPHVSCGGTLAYWARQGAEVHVVICTKGEKGTTDPGLSPTDLAELRRSEAAEAGAVLGVTDQHSLDHGDGELVDDAAFRSQLVCLVRRIKPATVLCPDPSALFFGQEYVNHRDHRMVGIATLDALAPASALPHYFPEAGPPHRVERALLSGTLEPDVWVDVSSTIDAKVAAVSCHRTQFAGDGDWAGEAVRRRAQEDGRRAGLSFAEGFRRLRLSG